MRHPDAISASLMAHMLDAVAREMGIVMERSTSSRYFQVRDMSTSLFDAAGRLIGQAEYIPLMSFALRPQLHAVQQMFAGDVHPGDVFLASDVYYGGNQALDVAVFAPVFVDGCLAFWTAGKGHVSDLGGNVPGSYNMKAQEVWQENVRLPPLRVARGGAPCHDVWTMILANSRTPDFLNRDLQAMMAACARGDDRLQAMAQRYGLAAMRQSVDDLVKLTAAAMQAEIAAMRPGVYESEAELSHDGIGDDRTYAVRLRLTVTPAGHIAFDFTGTSPQTRGFTNSPLSTTISTLLCALFMCVSSDIPHNDGCLEPVVVVVPEGCFLNPRPPAASQTGNFIANNVVGEAVLKALAESATARVTAGWCKALGSTLTCSNPRSGRLEVDTAFFNNHGGSGATRGYDGMDHLGILVLGGGTYSNDYERFEVQNPYRLLEHLCWTDSGGAGRWRGGLGTTARFLVEADDFIMAVHGDNSHGAHGVCGGQAAPPNRYMFSTPGGDLPAAAIDRYSLPRNTVVCNWNGGGGGYGAPLDRDAAAVVRDAREGVVSLQAAAEVYGLVVDPADWSAAPTPRRTAMNRTGRGAHP